MKTREYFIYTSIPILAITPFLTSLRIQGSFSIGGAVSFSIFFISMILSLKSKLSAKTAKFLLPLITLSIINAIHFFSTKSDSTEANVSVFLWPAVVFIIITTSRVYPTKRFIFNFQRTMIVGTFSYIGSALYFLVSYGHAPAVALAGIPFFCFNLIQSITKKKIIFILPLLTIFSVHALLSARIVVISEIVISIYALFSYSPNRNAKSILLRLTAISIFIFSVLLIIAKSGFMDKTISTGDNALEIGGVTLNTSGRLEVWEKIIYSAFDSPIFGKGLPAPPEVTAIPAWAHPHNDYLRLLHQTGLVGLVLWVTFMSNAIRAAKSKVAENNDPIAKPYHYLSLLMAVATSITMLTDNSITYSYVLYPMAIFIGLSGSMHNLIDVKKLRQYGAETSTKGKIIANYIKP